ncbi:MAG: carboxymuconolactone decarboxylase family protein [Pseudolabrys sp.]
MSGGSMPLVDPLPEDHAPELVDLIQFFRGPLGTVPNSVLTMQRRPQIARAFTELNKAVMENHGRVTAEQKRLIGYIASQAAGCRYCQAHTILAAERFGSSPERMAAIWDYAASPLFTPAEKAAFDFALAAASVPNAVTPEISAALKAHWTDDEIVEILGVVALFGYLNRWNDSMATTLEPIGVAAGERRLRPAGWTAGKHG